MAIPGSRLGFIADDPLGGRVKMGYHVLDGFESVI
jgi:hypothetical protein